jgi:hypothetical protein
MCKWFTYQLEPNRTQESFIFWDFILSLILKTIMFNCKLSKLFKPMINHKLWILDFAD